ncbi:MAG: SdpI family protein [Flavobacteriales bacterium]
MTTTDKIKKEAIILLILLAPIIAMLMMLDKLPAQLPMHWNIDNQVDRMGSRWELPLFNAGLYALLLILPWIDPRRRNYSAFSGPYYNIRLILTLFFSTLSGAIIAYAAGVEMNIGKVVQVGVILLITVLSNYFINLKPNWFVGIRTPWTMESEKVWRKTHRLASKLGFWGGILSLALSFLLSGKWQVGLLIAYAIFFSIVPAVYSYVIFRRESGN